MFCKFEGENFGDWPSISQICQCFLPATFSTMLWYLPDAVGVTTAVIIDVVVDTKLDIIVRLDKVGDTKPAQSMKYMKMIPCLHVNSYKTT